MKRSFFSLTLLCAVYCLGIQSLAQQPPERRPEGEGGPREEGRRREEGRPRDEGRPQEGRPEGRGQPEGRPSPEMQRATELRMLERRIMEAREQMRPAGGGQVEAMRNYLDVFDRYTRLSRDPASAGVAAVVTAGEILRARGADSAITYFNKVLPEVKNESVQRAIRLQLVELYKMSGQQDKALEQLQQLMVAAPEGEMPRPRPEGGEGGRPRPAGN